MRLCVMLYSDIKYQRLMLSIQFVLFILPTHRFVTQRMCRNRNYCEAFQINNRNKVYFEALRTNNRNRDYFEELQIHKRHMDYFEEFHVHKRNRDFFEELQF